MSNYGISNNGISNNDSDFIVHYSFLIVSLKS